VTARSWIIIIFIGLFAALILTSFTSGKGFRSEFCDVFSQANGFPGNERICGFFQTLRLCKETRDQDLFVCTNHS